MSCDTVFSVKHTTQLKNVNVEAKKEKELWTCLLRNSMCNTRQNMLLESADNGTDFHVEIQDSKSPFQPSAVVCLKTLVI